MFLALPSFMRAKDGRHAICPALRARIRVREFTVAVSVANSHSTNVAARPGVVPLILQIVSFVGMT